VTVSHMSNLQLAVISVDLWMPRRKVPDTPDSAGLLTVA